MWKRKVFSNNILYLLLELYLHYSPLIPGMSPLQATFEHLDRWLQLVYTILPIDTPAVLVGNKCDKQDERDVSREVSRTKDSGLMRQLSCNT